jgi:hypothetical protein
MNIILIMIMTEHLRQLMIIDRLLLLHDGGEHTGLTGVELLASHVPRVGRVDLLPERRTLHTRRKGWIVFQYTQPLLPSYCTCLKYLSDSYTISTMLILYMQYLNLHQDINPRHDSYTS